MLSTFHNYANVNSNIGGATRPLMENGDAEKLHGDVTVGPHPEVWTRGQKWKKLCQRWRTRSSDAGNSRGRL